MTIGLGIRDVGFWAGEDNWVEDGFCSNLEGGGRCVKLVVFTRITIAGGGLHVNDLFWIGETVFNPRTSWTRNWQHAFHTVESSIGQFVPKAGQDHSVKSNFRDECPSFQSIYWQL